MDLTQESTAVVIIGGGVAGLTLATFLGRSGVPCVIIERRDRAYVEIRARAGVVEARGAKMFERWGLAEKLLGGPVAQKIDYQVNGVGRVFEIKGEESEQSLFCTQQMLVNNLLRELIDVSGGDVRFEVNDVQINNPETGQPSVSFTDAHGVHEIACTFIVGCDGSRGTSRSSIPEGVLTMDSHEFGYAWLAVLAETPLRGHPIMGVSDDGFVGQLPRGPQRSRFYLQCDLSDGPEKWSDERVWDEIRLRLRDETFENAQIHDKLFVPLRSVVYSPMRYRNLFLAGDVAHLVPPTGAKGMNLALHDVDVLAQGLAKAVRDGDPSALEVYSDTCLARIWKYQEFSVWMTDTMHDAGDATLRGEFRKEQALARLDTLFSSHTAAQLHSEYHQGSI
ncbi:4-hydroxybenzoate 3-monooxygenase [Sphingomonas profundi]|uniref:4-hydroxybenzoate 3-monooxygenase n=1 Tax=Alterirhizorhabdus profundi TaxID=2681549 RepID=UPI0012E76DA3|nr:4-hydroxybenzoate 3-monooxygenase [Sphingomonas profundi]